MRKNKAAYLLIITTFFMAQVCLAAETGIIKFNEAMVGANHPTLPDTLNRGFLIQHNANGIHTTVPYATLTGVPTTFPWDNLTGKPTTLAGYGITDGASSFTTFPYDNLTGVPAAFSVADNSITPAKLSKTSGTADNTTFYRGDGQWATNAGTYQPLDADLTVLSYPTPWRVFYSNASNVITELALGASGTYLKSNGASSAPTFSSVTAVGNADTATALAANGANCSAGQAPLGVNASGAAEGCWTPTANLNNTTMDNTAITKGTMDNATLGGITPIIAITSLTGEFASLNRGVVSDAEFLLLNGMDNNIKTTFDLKAPLASPHFTGNAIFDNEITVKQVNTTCSYADNTCGINVSVSGPPATAPSGDLIWDNTEKSLRVGNGTTFDTIASSYKYYKGPISEPVAGDNSVFDGPLEFAQVWDNVLLFVQDNTGKLSGSASDNVTLNFSYCSSISVPTCTNVFTSSVTATGAAISYPALNNTTPSAGNYIRISIGTSNMTSKKLYVRIRYKER